METNCTENSERETAILLTMNLGNVRNQALGWGEYITGNESPLTASYEYPGNNDTGTPSDKSLFTDSVAIDKAFRDFERSNLKVCLNEWKSQERQTSFAAVETEFNSLQSAIQRHSLYKIFEFLNSEIDNGIPERFSCQSTYDYDTFESVMGDFIKELVMKERFKTARRILDSLLSFFPDSTKYKKLKELIAPPKLIESKKSKPAGVAKTLSLLRREGKKYIRKWVAVSDGQLLDISNSYAELAKKFGNNKNVIITRMV